MGKGGASQLITVAADGSRNSPGGCGVAMVMLMSASPLSQVNCIPLAESLELHPPSLIPQSRRFQPAARGLGGPYRRWKWPLNWIILVYKHKTEGWCPFGLSSPVL